MTTKPPNGTRFIDITDGEKPKPEDAAVVSGEGSLVQKIEKSKGRPKSYVLDLKIHTPRSLLGTSPLSGIDAAPALVRLAVVKGIDIIAVTDRNTGASLDTIVNAARGVRLVVLPGVEIRTCVTVCDDVVLTCLFPEHFRSADIAAFLTAIKVPESAIGSSNFVVPIPFEEVLREVELRDGVAFPSRIDKTPNRLAVLPELVNRYGFRAFDVAYGDSARIFSRQWPKTKFSLFSFSNASALAQVGSRCSKVKMASPGYDGVRDLVRRVGV